MGAEPMTELARASNENEVVARIKQHVYEYENGGADREAEDLALCVEAGLATDVVVNLWARVKEERSKKVSDVVVGFRRRDLSGWREERKETAQDVLKRIFQAAPKPIAVPEPEPEPEKPALEPPEEEPAEEEEPFREAARGRIILWRNRPLYSAERFLQYEQEWKGIRTLNHWRGSWWQWDGKRWRELDDDLAIEAKVQRFLMANDRRDESGKRVAFEPAPKHVSEVYRSVQRLVYVDTCFDQPGWFTGGKDGEPLVDDPRLLVAVKNGLLYLPTRELFPFTPRFWSSNVLEYAYNAKARCPRWMQFLDELWPGDIEAQSCLQEMIGLFYTDVTEHQKALMIKGPRRSGKGTIGRVCFGLLGPHNCVGSSMPVLADRCGLENWMDKKLALFPDTTLDGLYRAGMAIVVERIKSITGEDPVQIDRKNIKLKGVTLRVRIMILTNDVLKFDDVTGTLPTRFIYLELQRSFLGKEDPQLTAKLLTERAGILNWALDGWDRLCRRGELIQPASGRRLANSVSDLGTDVNRFVEERCELGADCSATVQQLFDEWQVWCLRKNIRYGWSEPQFSGKLYSAFPKLNHSRPRSEPGRAAKVYGIRLRPWK
jgi:putative DNA primase/helicase